MPNPEFGQKPEDGGQAERDRLAMEKMADEQANRAESGKAGMTKEEYQKLKAERSRAQQDAALIAEAAALNDMIGQSESAEIRRAKEAQADADAIWGAARKLDADRQLEGIEKSLTDKSRVAKEVETVEEERQLGANIAKAAKTLDAKRAGQEHQERLLADKYGDLQLELMEKEEKLVALHRQPEARSAEIDELEDEIATIKTEIEATGAMLDTIRGTNREVPPEFMEASNREITGAVDKGIEDVTRFHGAEDDFSDDEKEWFEEGEKLEWDNGKVIEQLSAEREKARKELYEMTKPNEPEFVQAALEKPRSKLSWKELKTLAKHAAKWATNGGYRQAWRALEAVDDALAEETALKEMSKPDTRTPAQRLKDSVSQLEMRGVRRAILRNRIENRK
jgi:hypothetical protein